MSAKPDELKRVWVVRLQAGIVCERESRSGWYGRGRCVHESLTPSWTGALTGSRDGGCGEDMLNLAKTMHGGCAVYLIDL